MEKKAERNSTFELIRIVAMLLVVYYHTFYYAYGYKPENAVIGGMEVILHIGVIIFVLLSGYFGIKTTLTGVG